MNIKITVLNQRDKHLKMLPYFWDWVSSVTIHCHRNTNKMYRLGHKKNEIVE